MTDVEYLQENIGSAVKMHSTIGLKSSTETGGSFTKCRKKPHAARGRNKINENTTAYDK